MVNHVSLHVALRRHQLRRQRIGFLIPKLDFLIDPEAPETKPNCRPEPEPNAPDDEDHEDDTSQQ